MFSRLQIYGRIQSIRLIHILQSPTCLEINFIKKSEDYSHILCSYSACYNYIINRQKEKVPITIE